MKRLICICGIKCPRHLSCGLVDASSRSMWRFNDNSWQRWTCDNGNAKGKLGDYVTDAQATESVTTSLTSADAATSTMLAPCVVIDVSADLQKRNGGESGI